VLLVAIAAAVAGLFTLVPSNTRAPKQRFSKEAVQLTQTKDVPLRRTDRRAIDLLLRRFVASAVARRDVAASYDLAAPELRQGMSRAQWAKGDIPVQPFPARASSQTWEQVDWSHPDDVGLDALYQPLPGAKVSGGMAFSIEVKRRGGRWRVASILPTAQFVEAGKWQRFPMVKTQKDGSPGSQAVRDLLHRKKLNRAWYLLPASLLGLIVLVPLGFITYTVLRDRRATRRYRSERRPLPPLPRS
jgi:hypothetical protein